MDRLQQHYKRHGAFKIKGVYPCRNPSVIESKLKSELNLKRISSEATGKNGEKITELFLPEYFHIVDTMIQQIIQMDMIENDKILYIEREKTKQKEIEFKQKEIDERIEIQRTEQLRLQKEGDQRIEMQRTEQLRLQLELEKMKQGKKSQQKLDSYFLKKNP